MLKQIVILITIVTFIMVLSMLNTGGLISTFLITFGAMSVFAVIVVLMMSGGKNKGQ